MFYDKPPVYTDILDRIQPVLQQVPAELRGNRQAILSAIGSTYPQYVPELKRAFDEIDSEQQEVEARLPLIKLQASLNGGSVRLMESTRPLSAR